MERPLLFYIMLTFFPFWWTQSWSLSCFRMAFRFLCLHVLLFLSEALPSLRHLSSWMLVDMAFNMMGSHQYVYAYLKCNNGHCHFKKKWHKITKIYFKTSTLLGLSHLVNRKWEGLANDFWLGVRFCFLPVLTHIPRINLAHRICAHTVRRSSARCWICRSEPCHSRPTF